MSAGYLFTWIADSQSLQQIYYRMYVTCEQFFTSRGHFYIDSDPSVSDSEIKSQRQSKEEDPIVAILASLSVFLFAIVTVTITIIICKVNKSNKDHLVELGKVSNSISEKSLRSIFIETYIISYDKLQVLEQIGQGEVGIVFK